MKKTEFRIIVGLCVLFADMALLTTGCMTDRHVSSSAKKLIVRLPSESSPAVKPKLASVPSATDSPSFETRFNATAARLRSEVEGLVKAGQFDKARDALWRSARNPDRELSVRLAPFRNQLLRQYVNRAQFIQTTNQLTRSVTKDIAKEDYAGARARLFGIKRIRVYPEETDSALEEVRQELGRTGLSDHDADRVVEAARSVLETVFSDRTLDEGTRAPGQTYKPDESALKGKLTALDRSLAAQGVPEFSRDRVRKTIDEIATPALRSLWRPQNEETITPPDAIGTSMLNQLIEAVRDDLYTNAVVPAWIANRAQSLRGRVCSLVDAGRLDKARDAIHSFGVVGVPEVDGPILAAKLGLLNARVNVAEWKSQSEALSNRVEQALAVEDYKVAFAAIDACNPVPVYGTAIEAGIRDAAKRALLKGVGTERAGQVVKKALHRIDEQTTARSDARGDARFREAYLAEINTSSGQGSSEPVDWNEVRESLERTVKRLVEDDFPVQDARALADEMMAGFMADDPVFVDILTTPELNRRLSRLKAELVATVSAAEALAKAGRAASLVDFESRIGAFTKAAGVPREPDLRRILAEGARILRLHRAGSPVSPAEATSLLAAAAFMGFDDVMELALALGGDMDGHSGKDELARPVLLLAVQGGFRGRSSDILASSKRSVFDKRGDGVLHYAVRAENRAAVLEFLRAGVDAKYAGSEKKTPLILAADLGYGSIVKALIPFSDVDAIDAAGYTALLRAADRGHTDIARALADAGASLGAHTKDGDGILELSAQANAPELLDWLLDDLHLVPTKRVVVQLVRAGNVPTLQRMGSLYGKIDDAEFAAVCERDDLPMVKYLVEQGQDVNAELLRDLPITNHVAAYLLEQGWLPRFPAPDRARRTFP